LKKYGMGEVESLALRNAASFFGFGQARKGLKDLLIKPRKTLRSLNTPGGPGETNVLLKHFSAVVRPVSIRTQHHIPYIWRFFLEVE